MTSTHWIFILVLALAAYAIRLVGLFAGEAIRRSRFAPVLDQLPGLIVVSLVGASLAGQTAAGWVAAACALIAAIRTGNVILTMAVGVAAFALLTKALDILASGSAF